MSIKEQLKQDTIAAMRSGDSERRNTLRMLSAAIKQVEVDSRTELDDEAVLNILTKQAKQRRESIADFEKAGRAKMAAEEKQELAVIETYLPQMMGLDEVKPIAAKLIAELGVTNMKGMGQVMGKLMPRLKGKADGRVVNQAVRELLG